MTARLIKGSPQALAWGARMQRIRHAGLRTEKRFFGPRGIFAKAGHTKHLRASGNPKELKFKQWVERVYGMRWSFYTNLPRNQKDAVQRNYLAWEKKHLQRNPITLVGNPPKQITANVAGILYRRVVEIRAEKTGGPNKGLWYHPFKAGSDVQLLALDTGDLLVHSVAGKKLWRTD